MTLKHQRVELKVQRLKASDKLRCDLLVVLFAPERRGLSPSIRQALSRQKSALVATIERGLADWSSEDESYLIRSSGLPGIQNILLLQLKEDDADTLPRQYARRVGEHCRSIRAQSVVVQPNRASLFSRTALEMFVEEFTLSFYSYRAYKSEQASNYRGPRTLGLLGLPAAIPHAASSARAIASACAFARDLVNMPPSDCTPRYLAKVAEQIAREQRLRCQIFDERALRRMGAHAILAVGSGSAQESYLIRLSYRPRRTARAPIALVGKGVTFDSGGLCIKTRAGMSHMKADMAGAAAVLGVMQIVRELEPSNEIDVYIPAVENMLGSHAFRPGDVLRSLSGKTIEVLNTDAEGRLILADALSYAVKMGAHTIIDIATLTGACATALADGYAGLFCNDERLTARLVACGVHSGEPVWPLPLPARYRKYLKSSVADMKNTGTERGGGAITAALFLQHFVGKARWAHLDIAGTAYAEDPDFFGVCGATGFGTRILSHFVAGRPL
ncbi:MAG: leucyl aminopeptidase family protein [Bdellovibrionota bacterium]|nr:MAG: leucyl aminopeptidase family protein [Bdellovibrionota bacterium]